LICRLFIDDAMTIFNLSLSPAGVVFLDDDPDFLETLALALPRVWHAEFHLRPTPLLARLQADAGGWQAERDRCGRMMTRWRQGAALPAEILRHWHSRERYALLGVCVVDYSMPAMTGLEFLSRASDWPGARILLTGRADEQTAVQAFNDGLIEQFIAKRDATSIKRLSVAVGTLMATLHRRIGNPWQETLRPEQLQQLNQPAVAAELERRLAERGWVEYVTLGDPYGILGVDSSGAVGWLQIEAAGDLSVPADMARSEGWKAEQVEQLLRGERLTDLELCLGLGQPMAAQLVVPFALGDSLLGAFFDLPAFHLQECSYDAFMAAQAERTLQR
jgi:CheY-like chemotaxis protein